MYVDIRQYPATRKNPGRVFRRDYQVHQLSKYVYQIRCEESDLRRIRRKCRSRNFEIIHQYEENANRSSNYRTVFFKTHPRPPKGYRCRYCHRRLKDNEIQVDHIYPVYAAKKSMKWLHRHGMNSVNDPRNLCAVCASCNKKKGKETGAWLRRARIRQHEWYWVIRKILTVMLITGIACFILFCAVLLE